MNTPRPLLSLSLPLMSAAVLLATAGEPARPPGFPIYRDFAFERNLAQVGATKTDALGSRLRFRCTCRFENPEIDISVVSQI